MKVIVRLATHKDIENIVNLAYEWHPCNEEEEERRKSILERTLNKKGHKIFIAEVDEKMVGWFDIRIYEDWFMLRKSIHIEHIFVFASYQRRGVGSAIMNKIKEIEADNMNLTFFYSEGIVDSFFVKNGFYVSPQHFYIFKKYRTRGLGVD